MEENIGKRTGNKQVKKPNGNKMETRREKQSKKAKIN